jgi:hypothetical protein
MNHRRKWFAYGMGCAAIASGIVACGSFLATDAYTALQIKQVQVLSGSDCNIPGTPTSVFRDRGVLDLALPDGSLPPYFLPVVVLNNLAAAGGSAAEEMNRITLTHFTVELSAPGVSWGAACPATFDTQLITVDIEPGGSVGEGLDIITPTHAQCLQTQVPPAGLPVTAKIWAKGRHGGTGITSAPFIFSVDVCLGCLQTDYTDATLVAYRYPADTPMCASLVGVNPYVGDPCSSPGQDKTIFCCAITQTINNVPSDVALCPGVFTGTADTATSTATATSTTTGP